MSILSWHLFHCTWLRCISSYTEDPSHGFFGSGWFVHSWFMDLNNPFEIIVYYILIEGMIGIDHWNRIPMENTSVCMITHWIELMVSHDVSLLSSYDLIKLLYCMISQVSWENIELVLKFVVILTCERDLKVVVYSLWIELLLMKTGDKYPQLKYHDISWRLKHYVPWGDLKEICSRKLWLY